MRTFPVLRFFLSIFLSLCLSTCLASEALAQEKADVASIRALEMKWTESYQHRQVDVLSSLLADDYVITTEDGSTYGKVGFVSHNAEPSEHVEVAEMSDLKIRMHGDTAVVTGSYHERGESGGKRYDYHDRLTDVWMKIGGKWLLIASHYSIPAS
ncbi:MAG TPA: nuclear transport factor 2 family protein [Candidatus Sulfotelmatobacter sp.]|nr:nuclear transport factor 2 family protein [Candidatus Sulfotelmatobacter sp.]